MRVVRFSKLITITVLCASGALASEGEKRLDLLPAKTLPPTIATSVVNEAVPVPSASPAAPVVSAITAAPAAMPIATPAPTPVPTPLVQSVPVKVLYVTENQPVQIVDSQGRLLQVIYLKKK